jgi:2-dehydro-3-deoxyphosphogluconate aldolase/(4S)-4-hydroxy-2-oxoglutarate aldolase
MVDGVEPVIIQTLLAERVVAVVRLPSQRDALPVARALVDGGVRIVEITITTPGAFSLIEQIRSDVPSAIVGAGSVLTRDDVDRCLDAGAEFLVSPIFEPDVLSHALSLEAPFCPGTFTPTEAYAAWAMGAPLVKVFPAARLGPKFVSDLKAPMPFLRLMPTGGITAQTVGDFLSAGADVVGAGSWLTPGDAIGSGDFAVIRERATELRQAILRASSAPGRGGRSGEAQQGCPDP